MTDNDDAQDQAEKLRQFFSVAQEFTNDFFDVMIKQIETFDCSDEERVIFTTFVARSNLATATDFLLEMEDNPQLVGEIAASRVNARNQRKKAEKMRLIKLILVLLMAAAVVLYFQQLPPMARCQNCSNRPADGKREPHSHRYKRRAFLCPILMLA